LRRKEILSSDARDGRRNEIADTFLQELLAAFQSTIHIQEVIGHPTPLILAISFMHPRYRDAVMKHHGVDSLKKKVEEMVGKSNIFAWRVFECFRFSPQNLE
jgi:hypothetical protein